MTRRPDRTGQDSTAAGWVDAAQTNHAKLGKNLL